MPLLLLLPPFVFVVVVFVVVFVVAAAAAAASPAINDPLVTHFRAFGPLSYITDSAINPLLTVFPDVQVALSRLTHFRTDAAKRGQAEWTPCHFNRSDASVRCNFTRVADPRMPFFYYAVANLSHLFDRRLTRLVLSTTDALTLFSSPLHNRTRRVTQTCIPNLTQDNRLPCTLTLAPSHEHQLLVKVVAQGNQSYFRISYLDSPKTTTKTPIIPLNQSVIPDILVRHRPYAASFAGNHLAIPLLNAHATRFATRGQVRLVHPPAAVSLSSPHLPRLAPRQTRTVPIHIVTTPEWRLPQSESLTLTFNITYLVADTHVSIPVSTSFRIRQWRRHRHFVFTYIDADNSVQAAAVVPPNNPCPHANGCVSILSTHGAGVDATADAWTHSYRVQNTSWVILPTGRRRYGMNWEGAQLQSALTSFRTFSAQLPGVPRDERQAYAIRNDCWLQAGHSMGGHGALLIASHYVDSLVAVLPAMAWMRLSTYGGERAFGESVSFSNAALRALLSVGEEQYAADLYHENLLGVPFLARVASNDHNVPPSELRKMCRLLYENELIHNVTQTFVQLSEVDGEGHWFDGVVDDDILQPFLDEHLNNADNVRLPRLFSVVTMNPDTSGSKGGLRITQMLLPTQLARLQVERVDDDDKSVWNIRTQNVARIQYRLVQRLKHRPSVLIIDGSRFQIHLAPSSTSDHVESFCTHERLVDDKPVWKVCKRADLAATRGIGEHGPLSAVLRRGETMIVYPDGDDELLSRAVDYANTLYLHGVNTHVMSDGQAVQDGVDSSEASLILLGDAGINRATREYAREGAVRVHFDRGVCVSLGTGGNKCFAESGTGAVWLGGGVEGGTVAVVGGVDREGLLAAMDLLPESPDSNGAEWSVVDARLWKMKGVGAVRAAGYFDERWKVLLAASYFDDGVAAVETTRCEVASGWAWRQFVAACALVILGAALGAWLGGRRYAAYDRVAGEDASRFGAAEKGKSGEEDAERRLLDAERDGGADGA